MQGNSISVIKMRKMCKNEYKCAIDCSLSGADPNKSHTGVDSKVYCSNRGADSKVYTRIFKYYLLLLVLLMNVECQSWNKEPNDTNIVLGETGILECSFNNQGPHNVLWTKIDRLGGTPLFINSTRVFNRPEFSHYSIEGEYNLKISNSKQTDDVRYECRHTGDDSLGKTVQVTILGKIIIIL